MINRNTLSLRLSIAFILISFGSKAQIGYLDGQFGADGVATIKIGTLEDRPTAIALQKDGKIIVSGFGQSIGEYTGFAVARLNNNGLIDSSFGNNGKVLTDLKKSGINIGFAMALQNDGKIVVGGCISEDNRVEYALARYNTDGSLDNSFDLDGIVYTSVGDSNDVCHAIAIQNDGKIVAAGTSKIGKKANFSLVRYNTDGSLDNSFGLGGKLIIPMGNGGDCNSMVIQNDGKIILAGDAFNEVDRDFALVRLHSNGSFDNSFGSGGKLTIPIGSADDLCGSVILQKDGKIIAVGTSRLAVVNGFALARFNSDGSLDNTFSTDGKLITTVGDPNNSGGYSIALQEDGKIIVAGTASRHFALVRYLTDGSLDNSFGKEGQQITISENNSEEHFRSVAIQNDGKIVAAGHSNNHFAVLRYNNSIMNGIVTNNVESSTLNIYPNPCSIASNLQSQKSLNNATIYIYNLLGQQVKVIEHVYGQTIKLDLGNLSSGAYLVHLMEDNELTATEKLIVTD